MEKPDSNDATVERKTDLQYRDLKIARIIGQFDALLLAACN